ncbi:Cu-binding protein [Diaporthe australafricana]|uniref:Cu-binding protein n=1 Tax=Diaporthe australafricana TaxID=127596 RepID=A0ABR3W8P2_9PEZI
MSRSMAPSRALLKAFQETQIPSRQCRRFLSSSQASFTRRPALASTLDQPSRHQPLVQKRFKYKSVDEAKSRYQIGPFSLKALLLFVVTAGGLTWYFEHEKERMQKKRIAEANKTVGRPKVGGSFKLVDQDGKPFTDQNMKGRYSLVYFGFTHCPDICPEELDKMAVMFDNVEKEIPGGLNGIFVTCDPARDGPQELKKYLAEFHPKFVGLTGTYDEVKAICKAYRVYFSTPSKVPAGKDYLVDHSIYFYLMDPEGDFVEALGRQHSPDQASSVILGHMRDWKGELKKQ